MYFINNPSTNPYFNIALEEYFLRESSADYFILYTHEPSVIVGKHQNSIAEINYRFISENNIAVVRRISGGGTVYHDAGNLNFAFIANSSEGAQIDFKKYTAPVIQALRNLGIDAQLEGKNDIRVNGLKISGNAEHVFKNRVLHHGTLLVNANLPMLSNALRVEPGVYTHNAVKSIRSKVANLVDFYPSITLKSLKSEILKSVEASTALETYNLSESETNAIEQKVTEKFSTREWNFDYSPKYKFAKNGIALEVENGIITSAKVEEFAELNKALFGVAHSYNEIEKVVKVFEKETRFTTWDFF